MALAASPGAESPANGEFLAAGGGAGEQQTREIDAGDEQNHAHGRPENGERAAQTSVNVVLERAETYSPNILGVHAAGGGDVVSPTEMVLDERALGLSLG